MILNVDPFLEPSNGPNYFPFDPNVLYEMKVDNNHDGEEDITFQFRFNTQIRQPGLFTGFVGGLAGIPPITTLDGPGSEGLSLRQTYNVTLIKNGKASNLTETEALKIHVVDLVSPSLPALLRTIDGRTVDAAGRHFVLHTAGAVIVNVKPGFLTRLLNTLIDPNLISLLFLAGIVGIGYEIFHPGVVLPGALGGVSLLAALFGFSVLPISWAGLALVLLGMVLLVVALTLSGLISLVFGLILLFHNAPSPYHTSVPLVTSIAVVLAGFWAFALGKAVKARRQPKLVGPEDIIGSVGEVRSGGLVAVRGELWQAKTAGGEALVPGQHVEVEGIEHGLVLDVKPVAEPEPIGSRIGPPLGKDSG